jgi:hypothetical protein
MFKNFPQWCLFLNEFLGIVKFWITFTLFFIRHVSSSKQGGYTWVMGRLTELCWRHPLEMGPTCLPVSSQIYESLV